MSQFFQGVTSGSLPPEVALQYESQDGTAVAAAGVLKIYGGPLPDPTLIYDDPNGVASYVDPNGSNNFFVYLTNRLTASGSTVGAVDTDLITLDLGATPGNYNFQFYVTGFESTSPAGCAFTVFGCIRTTGAAATIIVTQDIIADKEAALVGADFNILASGNSIVARATGVAGLTINFNVEMNYQFVS